MAGKRTLIIALVALSLPAAFLIGRTLGQNPPLSPTGKSTEQCTPQAYRACPSETESARSGRCEEKTSCVVYSLSQMGSDAEFGKWLADTIRNMVLCDSTGAVASYNSQKNVLVVCASPKDQGKVDHFLKELNKNCEGTAGATRTITKPGLIHAEYREDIVGRHTPDPLPGYPVPPPAVRPKHLFHFIIRYEGDGVVDANVAEVLKAQLKKDASADADAPTKNAAPAPCAPAPACCVPAAQGLAPAAGSEKGEKDTAPPSTTPVPPLSWRAPMPPPVN